MGRVLSSSDEVMENREREKIGQEMRPCIFLEKKAGGLSTAKTNSTYEQGCEEAEENTSTQVE